MGPWSPVLVPEEEMAPGLAVCTAAPVTARVFWEASLDSFVVGAPSSQKGPGMTWEGLHLTPHLLLCPEQEEETSLGRSVAPIGGCLFSLM